MCQIPIGKVVSVGNGKITVSCNGKTKVLDSKLVDVKIGDYVEFAGPIAIGKADDEEAKFALGLVK